MSDAPFRKRSDPTPAGPARHGGRTVLIGMLVLVVVVSGIAALAMLRP